jgi:hypothetical protein
MMCNALVKIVKNCGSLKFIEKRDLSLSSRQQNSLVCSCLSLSPSHKSDKNARNIDDDEEKKQYSAGIIIKSHT